MTKGGEKTAIFIKMSSDEEVDNRINEDDYEPKEDAEDYEDYRKDGYHPVRLG